MSRANKQGDKQSPLKPGTGIVLAGLWIVGNRLVFHSVCHYLPGSVSGSQSRNNLSASQRRLRTAAFRARAGRIPLLVVGFATLAAAAWGGLLRIGIVLPFPQSSGANWITFHGPLMVCGFLGTVIALERAVGLQKYWAYLAPLLTGAGSAWIVTGGLGGPGPWLIFAGSVLYLFVSARVVALSTALFTVVMGVGAVAWCVANGLWAAAWPLSRIVPWWITFLCLIIVGERLDLSRFQKPVSWSQPLLIACLSVYMAGVLISLKNQGAGEKVLGVGLFLIAAWLGRFDTARRTIRQPGLPRFMAGCLLSGYIWLALSGLFFLLYAPMESGPKYDAALHSFFVGFVFLMIFGHAPVIFPAVLQLPVAFSLRFYAHVALLHTSLILRVGGDLLGSIHARQWGAILNAAAMAVFLLNTISAVLLAGKSGSRHDLSGR